MHQKLNEGGHDGKAKTAATGALVLPYVNALLVCLALSNTDDEEDAAAVQRHGVPWPQIGGGASRGSKRGIGEGAAESDGEATSRNKRKRDKTTEEPLNFSLVPLKVDADGILRNAIASLS